MNRISVIDESRIIALTVDPSILSRQWYARAACAGLPGGFETYFPDDGAPSANALARCRECEGRHECLATALVYESNGVGRYGWYGGFGPEERDDLVQRLGISVGVRIDLGDQLDEPAQLALRLRASDHTIPEIAFQLGCTERTVYRYLAKSAA